MEEKVTRLTVEEFKIALAACSDEKRLCKTAGNVPCPLILVPGCDVFLPRLALERIEELEKEAQELRHAMVLMGLGSDPCALCQHTERPADCPLECPSCDADCGCKDCAEYSRFVLRKGRKTDREARGDVQK